MTTPQLGGAPTEDEPTIGQLIADTTREFSSLVRNEIELLKTELRVSVRAGGTSIAMFAVAGFLALLAIVMISFAFAFFLDWWFAGTATAFLLVFVIYLLIAALLVYLGVRKIKQIQAPEQTIESIRETQQVLKRG